jgi:undecaprenyl-diphosphatase
LTAAIVAIALSLPSLKFIDDAILKPVNATPDEWLGAMQLIAMIGDPLPLVIVAVLVAAWQLYHRQHIRALVMTASLTALPAFYAVKQVVQRARPVTDYITEHGIHGYSFPSGHATGTFAVYGMIAYLIYSHTKGRLRMAGVGLCVAVILLVSFTRVYLGVHFPTDVFAGWLLALVIITLLRSLSLYLAKRGDKPDRKAVEDTTEAPETIEN